jgi:hypothetical protein
MTIDNVFAVRGDEPDPMPPVDNDNAGNRVVVTLR